MRPSSLLPDRCSRRLSSRSQWLRVATCGAVAVALRRCLPPAAAGAAPSTAWVFPRFPVALQARLEEDYNPWLADDHLRETPEVRGASRLDPVAADAVVQRASEPPKLPAGPPRTAGGPPEETREEEDADGSEDSGTPPPQQPDPAQAVAAAGAVMSLASGLDDFVPEAFTILQKATQADAALGLLGFLMPAAALLRLGGEEAPTAASFNASEAARDQHLQHGGGRFEDLFEAAAWNASMFSGIAEAQHAELGIRDALEAAGEAWQRLWSQEGREALSQQLSTAPTAADSPDGDAGGAAAGSFEEASESAAGERLGLAVHGASARRDGEGWRLPFAAQLFRRNEGRHLLRLAFCRRLLFQSLLGVRDFDEDAQRHYEARARLVFRNLELFAEHRGQYLQARLAGAGRAWEELPPTDKDGRVEASLWISDEEMAEIAPDVLSSDQTMRVEVRLIPRTDTALHAAASMAQAVASAATGAASEVPPPPPGAPALGAAASAVVPLVPAQGLTVISDIDDTVKITEVFKGPSQMLQNTFLREFRAVSGMADLYRGWAKRYGASFEFVSKSPPELHEPLRNFLAEAGFPRSSVHLCSIWGPDRSTFKDRRIESLIAQFPDRRFVLVGDSGEHDPEIYAGIARRHPDRIAKVLIRQVSRDHGVDPEIFQGIRPEVWQVFDDPEEVELDQPLGPATAVALDLPFLPESLLSAVPAVTGAMRAPEWSR